MSRTMRRSSEIDFKIHDDGHRPMKWSRRRGDTVKAHAVPRTIVLCAGGPDQSKHLGRPRRRSWCSHDRRLSGDPGHRGKRRVIRDRCALSISARRHNRRSWTRIRSWTRSRPWPMRTGSPTTALSRRPRSVRWTQSLQSRIAFELRNLSGASSFICSRGGRWPLSRPETTERVRHRHPSLKPSVSSRPQPQSTAKAVMFSE